MNINEINQELNNFSKFVVNKVKNFSTLALPEQIGFGCIGGGIVLILLSLVFFIL
jgi:hypothetical protein